MDKFCFGIDIGGTTIKCGLFTANGELKEKWEIPSRTENGGIQVPQDVADTIDAKLKELSIEKKDVLGVGIGVPGPITEDGTVLKCANLGWDIFNVNEKMSALTGLKVATANDANVAALGEMWMGGGKGYKNIVMVTLGTGVGGGVILNGKIVAGSNGGGGEIGHMTMNLDEKETCGCGKHGHLEQYASATGIVRLAKKRLLDTSVTTSLRELAEVTAKDIFDHAKAGDTVALELVEELGRYLGLALSHVAAAVDPQVFVIGGGVSRAGSMLLDVISKYYNQNIIFALSNKEFRLAELGNDAGIYGCAKLVIG
ncbi:ROK family glucokinase [Lachnoclostridium phytofermentans]|uniref:Glucokinase n=1 Tax=Lachnoclostridium phytofermentans (strain ATCC 700394 / DSM 18823 / ISDg) TaxID=357809 RepID=A9KSS2_LACP7|nr:ROK family glucokinase [Lachnoclostridium phytofermentans]ABX40716.1 glucokinase, ROK family [Lachnoclostridium phytofermentans ISDg]